MAWTSWLAVDWVLTSLDTYLPTRSLPPIARKSLFRASSCLLSTGWLSSIAMANSTKAVGVRPKRTRHDSIQSKPSLNHHSSPDPGDEPDPRQRQHLLFSALHTYLPCLTFLHFLVGN
ncbi:hypothetical protein B0T19DRAFT_420714 [Cercophora scortea]|uniref:Uncharacterized protein n=1 Tax=Cercophora scortea TaxID=314031 RepID=A0AAE0IL60_9PEZI|nr:hypothetical protein B0T19DRAFT_420714 [Cercophora scortea]